ncbi:hypothetical protein [Stackebrandtia albiflava]|uniref:hypothetical protein n=1 Tax=Stackebrandtia albiflava TaxID=406432 RepID=UPI0011BF8625|nr:hypothetical protein [Stackebrandtia albiflava]
MTTIVAGGGGIAPAGIYLAGAEAKPADIKGGTVQEILESMQTALDTLWTDMQDAERAIAAYLNTTGDEVDGYLSSSSASEKRTILPHEPEDSVPDITDGADGISIDPEDDHFRPRE